MLLEYRTGCVERVGRDPEDDDASVHLRRLLQVPQQAREAPDAHQQHARRVGIERARVTDAPLAVGAPQPRDDVV